MFLNWGSETQKDLTRQYILLFPDLNSIEQGLSPGLLWHTVQKIICYVLSTVEYIAASMASFTWLQQALKKTCQCVPRIAKNHWGAWLPWLETMIFKQANTEVVLQCRILQAGGHRYGWRHRDTSQTHFSSRHTVGCGWKTGWPWWLRRQFFQVRIQTHILITSLKGRLLT